MDQAALDSVRNTIRKVHGCDSRWLETVPVAETYYKGEVEVFELVGHPTAKRCYGWLQPVGRERRVHVVLDGATVDSAAQAVRATIAARERTRMF
jgi:hypothetical protein